MLPPDMQQDMHKCGFKFVFSNDAFSKDYMDKLLLQEMFLFAMDHSAPATIVVITSDVDFWTSLSALRLRAYNVVLVHSQPITEPYANLVSETIEWAAVHREDMPEEAVEKQKKKQIVQRFPDATNTSDISTPRTDTASTSMSNIHTASPWLNTPVHETMPLAFPMSAPSQFVNQQPSSIPANSSALMSGNIHSSMTTAGQNAQVHSAPVPHVFPFGSSTMSSTTS